MHPDSINYSLYLVTDSTSAILGHKDLVEVVTSALKGGVTIVQYRDKLSDTADLIANGRALHAVTRKYNVPLLINDRVDVALAVGCEGVHVGQDDMSLPEARKLLPNKIIGVTVSSIEEAMKACNDGADYLGIGTMFATATKTNTKGVIGTAGTKAILEAIAKKSSKVRTVSIGGINASNVQRVLYQSSSRNKSLDGVAVVSAIIAAPDPEKAASTLMMLVRAPPPFAAESSIRNAGEQQDLIADIPTVLALLREEKPLCHNMTNLVVQNFAANTALCIGASPIMANYGKEAEDLCKFKGSLVINMGTVTPDGLENYLLALNAYNNEGAPVLFDPVGAGATSVRKAAVKTLLAGGYFDVIKGNEAEIIQVYGWTNYKQHGVDSGESRLDDIGKARLVRDLALRERNVVVMTGPTDFASDGERTFTVKNGHEYLGAITGSGCVLGTTIACMLAVCRHDKLLAAIAGLLVYEIAAELAAGKTEVNGPGTFVPAFLDELYHTSRGIGEGDSRYLDRAKLETISIT